MVSGTGNSALDMTWFLLCFHTCSCSCLHTHTHFGRKRKQSSMLSLSHGCKLKSFTLYHAHMCLTQAWRQRPLGRLTTYVMCQATHYDLRAAANGNDKIFPKLVSSGLRPLCRPMNLQKWKLAMVSR